MKVSELIEKLQQCDPEATVHYDYDGTDIEVEHISRARSDYFHELKEDAPHRKTARNAIDIW